MKTIPALLVALLALTAELSHAGAGIVLPPPPPPPPPSTEANPTRSTSTCAGRFPNPITDICWSCMAPFTIGSSPVGNYGNQEDNSDNPSLPVCSCVVNPTIGVPWGFWEPARYVEVVRTPYCMPTLGGVSFDPGVPAQHGLRHTDTAAGGDGTGNGFYQAHFYKNPILTWMGLVTNWPCLEKGSLDLAYMTEVDPTWADDELSLILNPEAALFANPVAMAACAADCVSASLGFGLNTLFWCDGCQGSLFPMNGYVAHHMGGVRTAELITGRLTAKMHRQLLAWGWHGKQALCGPVYEPEMDKTAYKTQLMYPIAQAGSNGVSCNGADTYNAATKQCTPSTGAAYTPSPGTDDSRCCQPFGRTTILWGAGKAYPVRGEDFAFMLFRKRNCCVGR